MKNRLLYASLFPLVPVLCLIMIYTDKIEGPERKLNGTWQEVSWKYEKMDHQGQSERSWMQEMDDGIKREISAHLIIHKAETWEFAPDRKLLLSTTDGGRQTLSWTLKGRGNILELTGADGRVETYLIQKLTGEKMVLHFNTDMQVRGIVEMEFNKVTN